MHLLQAESAEETIECQNFAEWIVERVRGNYIKLADNICLTSQINTNRFVYPNILYLSMLVIQVI